MRITELAIPADELQNSTFNSQGLTSKVGMSRLGKVVLLTGANGAGKTRLLNLVDSICSYYCQIPQSEYLDRRILETEVEIEQVTSQIASFHMAIEKNPNDPGLNRALNSSKSNLEAASNNLVQFRKQRKHWSYIDISKSEGATALPITRPVFFVPTDSHLEQTDELNEASIKRHASECEKLGSNNTRFTVPSYLHVVLRRARNATLSRYQNRLTEQDAVAISAGESLIQLVGKLLGEQAKLEIDNDDQVMIFGRRDFVKSLSQGQKVLLKLAVQLHAQKTEIGESLFVLDEPENHLHPAVLNSVIDVLMNEVTSGQIWIATHSVPLIARLTFLDPTCIWFMERGIATHAGRKPETVLRGLLGDDQQIACLRDFSDLPAKMAANRYAVECLLPATTVAARINDKQQVQMVDAIQDVFAQRKLRVLDFGAGQGRLLAALRDANMDKNVDYVAFDLESESNQHCKREIAAVYGEQEIKKRFFTSIERVLREWAKVDVIVMCNVLHEIPPDEWQKEIGSDSRLMELLEEDGHLLVVEDQRIPVGENAHDYGFLVFDELQFQKLFDFTRPSVNEDDYKKYDADAGIDGKEGRLLAHRFSRSLVLRYTPDSQQAAIADLYKTAGNEMNLLRKKAKHTPPTFLDGQQHAFWMAQYANAALWLSDKGAINLSK